MASIIEKSSNEQSSINKDLNKLIKHVLNNEDKNLDIYSILQSIKFPESLDGFDEKIFREDIKFAFKCIRKFRSKNKKAIISGFILQIERYVLTHINENTKE